jgi:hypothetical protein
VGVLMNEELGVGFQLVKEWKVDYYLTRREDNNTNK